jgi:sec-independent protein translocase protein TatA
MFDVGGAELIVIILAVLLLFGPKSLPQFAQQLGKGLRQFRKAQEDLTQQIRDISADAAVREALDMTPTSVIRPPSGGIPVSRGGNEAPPADQDATPARSSEGSAPDAGPDASLSSSPDKSEPSPTA